MDIEQSIKIPIKEHLIQPLRVHQLLADYKIEDVWRVPVQLQDNHSLHLLMELQKKTDNEMLKKGVVGFLFKLRLLLGKTFGWDSPQDYNRDNSLRARYAKQEGISMEQLPTPGDGSFIPVYQLENEYLSEIENKTVEAAIHFSRVPLEPGIWSIHMTIYVKPKGLFGRLYMLLIKPFRVWIVYPAIMNAARKRWSEYLKNA